jgi:hypothetical protein
MNNNWIKEIEQKDDIILALKQEAILLRESRDFWKKEYEKLKKDYLDDQHTTNI